MSKKTTLKPLAIAVGATFVTALATTPVANAAENPFALSELSGGYMVADSMEGKCGEGKCGGEKSTEEGKCGEGKCGGDKKTMEEGKCGGDTATEGAKAEGEGKCGEGKCGGDKK